MNIQLLIKLGKSSYLPDFRRYGQFRMGTFSSFRISKNDEIGYFNEGAHKIERHKKLLFLDLISTQKPMKK